MSRPPARPRFQRAAAERSRFRAAIQAAPTTESLPGAFDHPRRLRKPSDARCAPLRRYQRCSGANDHIKPPRPSREAAKAARADVGIGPYFPPGHTLHCRGAHRASVWLRCLSVTAERTSRWLHRRGGLYGRPSGRDVDALSTNAPTRGHIVGAAMSRPPARPRFQRAAAERSRFRAAIQAAPTTESLPGAFDHPRRLRKPSDARCALSACNPAMCAP